MVTILVWLSRYGLFQRTFWSQNKTDEGMSRLVSSAKYCLLMEFMWIPYIHACTHTCMLYIAHFHCHGFLLHLYTVVDPDIRLRREDNLMCFPVSHVYFYVGRGAVVYSQTGWWSMAGFVPLPHPRIRHTISTTSYKKTRSVSVEPKQVTLLLVE